jgi:uncharacterized protein (TIGR00369 family)
MTDKTTGGRNRTITWQDPQVRRDAIKGMTRLEGFRASVGGALQIEPVDALLGMSLLSIEPGHAVYGLEPAEYLYNPGGVVQGGVLCALVDIALAMAVNTALPDGVYHRGTLELKVNFVRPVTEATGPVRCEAETIHVGGSVVTAQAHVLDRNDTLYAHATTTYLVAGPAGSNQITGR